MVGRARPLIAFALSISALLGTAWASRPVGHRGRALRNDHERAEGNRLILPTFSKTESRGCFERDPRRGVICAPNGAA